MATANQTRDGAATDSHDDLTCGVVLAAIATVVVASEVCARVGRIEAISVDEGAHVRASDARVALERAIESVATQATALHERPETSTRSSRNRLMRALTDLCAALAAAREVTS